MFSKQIKNILVNSGFHHSYNVWVNNEFPNLRIKIEMHNGKITLWPTLIPNHYNAKDKIIVTENINKTLICIFDEKSLLNVLLNVKNKL